MTNELLGGENKEVETLSLPWYIDWIDGKDEALEAELDQIKLAEPEITAPTEEVTRFLVESAMNAGKRELLDELAQEASKHFQIEE